ncbi:MAG: radical SAM protein [Bacteroidales bacterium]
MKKILLINSNIEILPYPVAPLGIAMVATSLKDEFEINVFDFAFNSTESLIKHTKEFNPDFIGIGLRNIDNVTMRNAKWYIEEIRNQIVIPLQKYFSIPIIIGGSGFSITANELLEYFNLEYGIVGEGETTFKEFLKRYFSGHDFNDLENLVTKTKTQNGVYNPAKGKLSVPRANIDQFIDYNPYVQRSSYPVQTKRGCAFNCIYCSYPTIEGKYYRLRSVKDIVDEIQEIKQRIPGVTFEIVDSTFNSPLKHAIAFCDEIITRGLKVKLRTMGVNPGNITDELVKKMRLAGFSQIDCTPETGSDQLLKRLRKNFNLKKLIKSAELIQKYDMPTMWFFMFGLPGETEETINETFHFIDNYISKTEMVHVTEGIRIIPNTELYQIAINEGILSGNENMINPVFYVSPTIGKSKLTEVLSFYVDQRSNVVNSINSSPDPDLLNRAIQYRRENKIDEPMFRTLLRLTK